MKEVNLKEDLENIEKAELLDEIEEKVSQFYNDNQKVQLWTLNKALIFSEATYDGRNDYLLSKDEAEAAKKDSKAFLRDRALEWAANEDDSTLAACQWGMTPDKNYAGADECMVLIQENYYGYNPCEWATDDDYNTRLFRNSQAAKEWIAEQYEGVYYLQHNEAGRPDYYIVEA